jgi:Mannosyl-glycoprotein endo-beta-N-acetylglucosaminidase
VTDPAPYIATVLPYARIESLRTGIPVSVMLAQSGVETGWGTSNWFREHLNPAGIGVTGAPGAGATYRTLAEAFRDYANKLLGIGEAGQAQFAADVQRGADDPTLLRDLERSPWAAGHYGGSGLERTWSTLGLGTYDDPATPAPAAGTLTTGSSSSATGVVPTSLHLGPLTIPTPSDLLGGAKRDVSALVLTGLFLSAGLALVVIGGYRTVGSSGLTQRIGDVAQTGATLAAAAA